MLIFADAFATVLFQDVVLLPRLATVSSVKISRLLQCVYGGFIPSRIVLVSRDREVFTSERDGYTLLGQGA